jgi:hypothetical protein
MWAMVRYSLLTVAFALATRALGWWSVPIVAGCWAYRDGGRRRTPWEAGLGAIFGWALIIVWTDTIAPLSELLRRVSALLDVPPILFLSATLLYGGILAWSAALLASMLLPLQFRYSELQVPSAGDSPPPALTVQK